MGDSFAERMASSSRVEINKFNGKISKLWKLKMEDLWVDKEQWLVVVLGTKPTTMSTKDWEKMDRKVRSTILSLKFGTVECFWRRLYKEVVGKVREFISVKIPGKKIVFA